MAVETWDDVAAAKRLRKIIEENDGDGNTKMNTISPGGLMDVLRVATAGNGSAARRIQSAIETIPVGERARVIEFALSTYGLEVLDVPDAPLGVVIRVKGFASGADEKEKGAPKGPTLNKEGVAAAR